jgi:hypothetical protein
MRERYISLRRRYEPAATRLAIVAESPPASGLYFYDEIGATTEPLFAAVMKQLRLQPSTKAEGLSALRQEGWLLVDATYQPVNALDAAGRDAVIVRDYPLLREDLKALAPERVVLIKKNVCVLLEPRLVADGFRVINEGRAIFPAMAGRATSIDNSRRSRCPSDGAWSPVPLPAALPLFSAGLGVLGLLG